MKEELSLTERMIRSKGIRAAFLLGLMVIAAIVLFHDYNMGAHEINSAIHLLDESEGFLKGRIISQASGSAFEINNDSLCAAIILPAGVAMDLKVNYIIMVGPAGDNIRHSKGFDPVHISPPRTAVS